jgi:hypothetical protein
MSRYIKIISLSFRVKLRLPLLGICFVDSQNLNKWDSVNLECELAS